MVRKSKSASSGSGILVSFMRSTSFGPFGFGFMLEAEVATYDRRMAERIAHCSGRG
jgi:hypothetical protein